MQKNHKNSVWVAALCILSVFTWTSPSFAGRFGVFRNQGRFYRPTNNFSYPQSNQQNTEGQTAQVKNNAVQLSEGHSESEDNSSTRNSSNGHPTSQSQKGVASITGVHWGRPMVRAHVSI